jgi:hypothetical protein
MSVMLTLLMGKRFLASRKMMPAGMTTVKFGIISVQMSSNNVSRACKSVNTNSCWFGLGDIKQQTLSLAMAVRYGVKLLEK